MKPTPGLAARATVKRIIDGDTLDLEVRIPMRVRLLDCWAEEPNSEAGSQAKEHLSRMAPPGSEAVVHVPTERADSLQDLFTFGRVLGNVWREGDEESLSEAMVASGHATKGKSDGH